MVLESGLKAPDFSMEAAVSGKTIAPAMGTRLVLVFHGNKTQDAPKTVGKAVRADHPDAGDVLVANVVNLKPFNGMFKKVAEAQVKQTYNHLAGKIGDGAEDYVILLPDWENALGPQFGIEDSDKVPGVVVLDGEGKVLAAAEGDGLVETARNALS